MSLGTGLTTLLVVSVVAAVAPFVASLLRRIRLPQVVVFIVGGVLVGPQVLGWAQPKAITLLANVGLGFLFLMAGYELDPRLLGQRVGRLAIWSWLVTAVLAVAIVGWLASTGFVHAYVPVAIALTTTSLGTLLPILRDNGMLEGAFGRYIMPAGAVGEFFPIAAIAVFLGAHGRLLGMLSVFVMGLVALALTVLPRLVGHGRLWEIFVEGEGATSQTTLRLTIVMLFGLLVVARDFGLDVVLGAFLAGLVLRRWHPGEARALEGKLDAVGYGFFIPVFFIWSGMNLALASIAHNPLRLVVFFLLLLVVRGMPALFFYRRDLPRHQRVEMGLLTATALPLLVALSEIGLSTGDMLPQNAAALVAAGVLSVLVFPGLAVALHRRFGVRGAEGRATQADAEAQLPHQRSAAEDEESERRRSGP
jgi:Kef-type K+ transport system membrane component KefB